MSRYNIKKMTHEDRFGRYYVAGWERKLKHIKKANRKLYRKLLKDMTEDEFSDYRAESEDIKSDD